MTVHVDSTNELSVIGVYMVALICYTYNAILQCYFADEVFQ